MAFKMRTSKPGAGNKFYIRKANGGYSLCITGKPTDKNCNVLANCVGYACGRFNEIIGSMKYTSLNCNAENFIERAKSLGLKISSKPTLGGIMVWQKGSTLSGSDGAGHVEVVEKIYDNNHIYTSSSGYGSSAFWNSHRYNSNGRWGLGSGYKFRGCIINPAVKEEAPAKDPDPVALKYRIGDTVTINGVYTSSVSTKKLKPLITKGEITRIVNGARNPYLLNNGNIGWVNNNCIVSGSTASTTTTTTNTGTTKTVSNCKCINLRTSASYGNNVYKIVYAGTKVEYLGMSNGWAKIKYNGKTLYCGKQYLK